MSQELQQLLRTQLQLQTTTTVEPSSLSPGAKINVGIKEPVTQFHLHRDLKFNFLCFLTDSVQKICFISLLRVSKMHVPRPFRDCKLSSGGTGLLQMIIQRGRPLADDHPVFFV